MRFNIYCFTCFMFLSCGKDHNELFSVRPVTYNIGNENVEDRLLEVTHTSPADFQTYYAEFRDTIKDKNIKGWEFTLLDKRSGIIQSILKVFRGRKVDESKIVFDPGDYFTARNSFITDEVVVQFETTVNGITQAYRANKKKPENVVRIVNYSPAYLLMTFDLEASPTVGTQTLSRLKGRFLILKD
jgi:hypothetical protein